MAKLQEATPAELRWHSDDAGEHGNDEEDEEEMKHVADERLKGLNFREKWDVIGSPKEAAPRVEPLPPLSPVLGVHETGVFSGIHASMKLRNGDMPQRTDAAVLTTPKSPKVAHQMLRTASESGSPLRLLPRRHFYMPSRPPSADLRCRPDNIGLVQEMLEERIQDRKRPRMQRSSPSGSQSQPQLETPGMQHVAAAQNLSSFHADASSRNVILSEFRRWCLDTFQEARVAWSSLNSSRALIIKQEDFAAALRNWHYPHTEQIGILYQCLSVEEGIRQTRFCEVLDSVSVGRTAQRTSLITAMEKMDKKREDMDDVEAAFAGYKKTSLERDVEKAMERIRRMNPVLGELFDFFMGHFGSLKLAFKSFDINGNGSLSVQEFVDSLQTLRSRKGTRIIEVHMETLFNKLDFESKGSIVLKDVVYELEKNPDLFLVRLRKFCDQVGKKTGAIANQDESAKLRHYASLFRVGKQQSQMNKAHFKAALTDMRYPLWHARELYKCLDKDDSGNLTLAEFTAFMSPDPPVRRERKGSLVPLGSEQRIQQVKNMHNSMASSQKFATMGRHQDGGVQKQRPDWIAIVDAEMKERRQAREERARNAREERARKAMQTESRPLSRTGAQVVRGDKELRDLASRGSAEGSQRRKNSLGCAMADHEVNTDRCKVHSF